MWITWGKTVGKTFWYNCLMISKSDLKKPLKALSRLRAEEVSKYRAAEFLEELEAMGQSSDYKAAKWVREHYEKLEKKDREKSAIDLETLGRLRKLPNKQDYLRYLCKLFLVFLQEEKIPKKYFIDVSITDIGIIVKIKKRIQSFKLSPRTGAFKAVGIPFYDRHACKIMAVRVGNTVAKLEGYVKKSDGGVMLPDQEDAKTYGFTG